MRVCDVVLNSIWFDPRVNRQISTYSKIDNIMVTCVGLQCRRYDPKKVAEIIVPTTLIKQLPIKHKILPRFIWRFYRRWKTDIMIRDAIITQEPDIIHANDFDALVPAFMASKKLGCKIVYDSHEIYMGNQLKYGKCYLAFLKILERYITHKVDLMVCVSNAAADYFAEEYNILRPMVVTNCAHQDTIVRENVKKHQGFEILCHGQFYPGRGYDIIVQAAKLLIDFPELKMALRGFGKIERELKEYVNNNKLKNVIFYPPVDVQELIPMASKSHVGVAITEPICLNFRLSVSNKLFEYAAAGIPVIMSDIPEHRLINDKYQIGIIISENTPEMLTKAICKLYENKDFYEQCRKNALKMSECINWEKEFKKLYNAECNLIGNENGE